MRTLCKLFACLFVLVSGCKGESIHLGESTSIQKSSVTEPMVGDWGFGPSAYISIKPQGDSFQISWHHDARKMEVGNATIDGEQVKFDEVDYSLDGKSYAHEGFLKHCTIKLADGKLVVHCVGADDPKGNFLGPASYPPLKK